MKIPENTDSCTLKIYYDTIAKRCNIPTCFRDLTLLVINSFPELDKLENYNIIYKDDEGDSILLESEYDYQNALLFLYQSKLSILKIYLIKKIDTSIVVETSLWDNFNNFDYDIINFNEKDTEKRVNKANEIFLINQQIYIFVQIAIIILKRKFFECFLLNCDILINNKRMMCPNCNRKFEEKSYNRHMTSCCNKFSKRSPFNSKKQRIISIEHFNLIKKNIVDQINENIIFPIVNPFFFFVKKSESLVKNAWRERSENIRNRKIKNLK
jgi:hypothetical protein